MNFRKGLSERDKRALRVLAAAVALVAAWQIGAVVPATSRGSTEPSIEALEQRYLLARERFARQPAKRREARQLAQSVERLENRLLRSSTPALAQAEIRTLVSELLHSEGIDLERSSFEAAGSDAPYVAIPLGLEFTCSIEQFIGFMVALSNAPPILATRDLEIAAARPEAKSIRVQLTVEGYLAERPAASAEGATP